MVGRTDPWTGDPNKLLLLRAISTSAFFLTVNQRLYLAFVLFDYLPFFSILSGIFSDIRTSKFGSGSALGSGVCKWVSNAHSSDLGLGAWKENQDEHKKETILIKSNNPHPASEKNQKSHSSQLPKH